MNKKKWLLIGIVISYLLFLGYKHLGQENIPFENIQPKKESSTIVTSFYPMYVQTKALTKGDNSKIVNMASETVGRLHDYQLTVEDTKKIYDADLLVINGLGSENFIEKAYKQNDQLKVIDASHTLEEKLAGDKKNLLQKELEEEMAHEEESAEESIHEHELSHEHEENHNHEFNDHIWMSIKGTIEQVSWLTEALASENPHNAGIYRANGKTYREALQQFEKEAHNQLDSLKGQKVVMVHETFYYLAQEFELEIIEMLPEGSYENASPKQIEHLIQHMKEEQVKVILTEARYKDIPLLKMVEKETGCQVVVLDALLEKSSVVVTEQQYEYIERMKKNIEVLREAFENE